MAAIAAGELDLRDILAAVTPGGGKSLLPVIAASRLAAGVVDRVCWVVPRDSLRLQAEEAFADPAWRATLGHALSVRAADDTPDPSRGLAGYSHSAERTSIRAEQLVDRSAGRQPQPNAHRAGDRFSSNAAAELATRP